MQSSRGRAIPPVAQETRSVGRTGNICCLTRLGKGEGTNIVRIREGETEAVVQDRKGLHELQTLAGTAER